MRADKKEVSRLLKTARGQLDGILKMVEDDRYCIDISNQLLASISILKKANKKVIEGHINGCLIDAFENGNGEEKTKEILDVINKLT